MVETALLNWTLQQLLTLVVIATRVGPVIFFMPITGSRGVPTQIKILFSLMCALVLLPVVPVAADALPTTGLGYLLFVVREIAFGAVLSLFVRFLFAAVQLAGQYVSISMGMGMAATMDPQFGTQTSLVGIFWNLLAILLFLSINGHHMFITTLVDSFRWVAPGGMLVRDATLRGLMLGVANMFVLGVKVMAPAGAVLFFSHIAMGVLAKTVPQIPVMIVAMPLNIALGFIFIGLSLSYFLPLLIGQFANLGRLLPLLARGMGG